MNSIPPVIQAALGAVIVGIGLSLMLGAAHRIAEEPCVDCGEASPEDTAEQIARASADMNGSDD